MLTIFLLVCIVVLGLGNLIKADELATERHKRRSAELQLRHLRQRVAAQARIDQIRWQTIMALRARAGRATGLVPPPAPRPLLGPGRRTS